MSHNDITGDAIRTKPSKAYAENYDAIFRPAPCAPFPGMDKPWPQEKIEEFRGVLDRIFVRESESCPMCDVVVEEET